MTKVKARGIDGAVWQLISDWLSSTSQQAVVIGVKSSWLADTSVVPHKDRYLGQSYSGFMWTTKMQPVIDSSILKLADDTELFGTVESVEDTIETSGWS